MQVIYRWAFSLFQPCAPPYPPHSKSGGARAPPGCPRLLNLAYRQRLKTDQRMSVPSRFCTSPMLLLSYKLNVVNWAMFGLDKSTWSTKLCRHIGCQKYRCWQTNSMVTVDVLKRVVSYVLVL